MVSFLLDETLLVSYVGSFPQFLVTGRVFFFFGV
jgi:hypothetical protein